MVGTGEDSSDERQGRQERRSWRLRHVRGFLSLPGNTILNGGMAGSITRLGVGASAVLGAQRRSLLLGAILLLAMMTALVVAQFAGPQGQSGPSPAFAQGYCGNPIVALTPGAGRFTINFTYPTGGGTDPTLYRHRNRKASPVGAWTPWIFPGNPLFETLDTFRMTDTVLDLEGETAYNVEAQSVCFGDRHSNTVTANVTTLIVRDFVLTLTQNGREITEIPEGESATLTVSLDTNSAPFADNTDFIFGFLFATVSEDDPPFEPGEAMVTSDDDPNDFSAIQTLVAGERSFSFTVSADPDNLEHHTAPDDDEHPLEASVYVIKYNATSTRIRVEGHENWVELIYIRDGIPPVVTATPSVTPSATPSVTPSVTPSPTVISTPTVVNNRAMGMVTIDDSTPSNSPELGDTLTASTTATDADGLTPPTTFSYQWLRNGTAIVGTGATYDVTVADIGSTLEARAHFVDDLSNAETLTSTATARVPSGPVIRAPNGFFWDNNAATDDSITVDTSTMDYSYLPSGATFTFEWFYVDASGTEEDGDTPGPDFMSQTYGLTSVDDMKYMQVEVFFTDTNGFNVAKLANVQTRLITERPPLEIPMGVTATVPATGGSVALSWGLTSLGGERPSGFKYRFKPTAQADTEFTEWTNARGGLSTRSVRITGNLINNVPYTFEVASYSPQVAVSEATTESTTAVYRQKTRDC